MPDLPSSDAEFMHDQSVRKDASRPGGDRTVQWRRNLAALWTTQFMVVFGFTFVFPFLPIYLHGELGVHDPHALALWTGIIAGGVNLTLIVATPIWGSLGDRFGRKQMSIRAGIGGGLTTALMGLVTNPLELLGVRLLQGTVAGSNATNTALVASETPAQHVGWALGILSSSIALGRALGPATGGLFATVLNLRIAFLVGGLLILAATLPVAFVVKESPSQQPQAAPLRTMNAIRSVPGGTMSTLVALLSCQLLINFSYAGAQQMVVLRILEIAPNRASFITGVAFAAVGLCAAISAVTYSRLLRLFGYRRLAMATAAMLGLGIALQGWAPSLSILVAAIAVTGLVFGALTPAVNSMIGLETPHALKSTIFGVSGSAFAIGGLLGPIVCGSVAALSNVQIALVTAGALSPGIIAVLFMWVREPTASAYARM